MKKTFHALGEHRFLLSPKFIFFLFILCIGVSQLHADNIVSGGTKIKLLPGTSTVSSRDLILKPGSQFVNSGTVVLKKDLHNECSAPTLTGSGMVKLDGDFTQIISGNNCVQNLIIDNETGINLAGLTKVEGTLFLEHGILNLGDNNLILGPNSVISGQPSSAAMINATGNGQLQKQFPLDFTGSFTFPVGDNNEAANYSPVILHYKSGSYTSGNFVGVNLRNFKYPDPSNTDNYLKRYWNISTDESSNILYDIQFLYSSEDIVGEESLIKCLRYYQEQTMVYGQADSENNILNAESLNFKGSFTGGGGTGVFATLSGPSSVCHNSPGYTYYTEEGKSNYLWTVTSGGYVTAGGTASDNFIVITWVTLAPQTISVNYTGSSTPAVMNITVNPRPVPVISGPSTACENSTQMVYTTETGMTNYQWSISQGGTIMAGQGTNQVTVDWNTPGEQSVTVIYNNLAGCAPVTSTVYPVTVNSIVDVDVSVIANINNICAGTEATFTALPVNGGTNPSFQWFKNSLPVGVNSPVYSCVPANGDKIKVVLNSSEMCNNGPVTSDPVTMIVNPVLQVSVTVQPTATQVCEGTQVTFNANPVNGGTNPTYTWFRNSVQAGSNSPVFSCVPINGDIIQVVLTSSEICQTGPAQSNPVSMIVKPLPVPTIAGLNDVCAGVQNIIYHTEENMSGYVWTVSSGGIIASGQGTSTIHVNWNAPGNQQVTVNYTDLFGCTAANGTAYPVNVNTLIPVGVSIIASNNNICAGTEVTFTATPVNGGLNPSYQWYKNSIPVGTNSPAYPCVPGNGDVIKVVLTSSVSCPNGPAESNSITMVVNPVLPVSVTVQPSATQVCEGTQVVFNAFPVNGGTNPTFTWFRNAAQVGINSPVYSCIPNNGDIIHVVVASSEICQTGPAQSSPVIMVVNPLPAPTITGLAEVCAGVQGIIYKTEENMSGYSWTVSNGGIITSGEETSTISVNWTNPGNNNLTVNYVNGNNCTSPAPAIKVVHVNELPSPVITGDIHACAGASGVVYSTEPGMSNYQWTISPGGTITSGIETNEVTVTWNNTGSNFIKVNYTNVAGCTALLPASKTVFIHVLPEPTINGPSNSCLGTVETYTTEPGMNNYNWSLSPGGIIVGGSENSNLINVKWTTRGPQFIKVNYSNAYGCFAVNPTFKDVSVTGPSISGPTVVCKLATERYETQAGMDNSYIWSYKGGIKVGGGQITDNYILIKWTAVGNRYVSVTYTDNGCTATSTLPVLVNYTSPSLVGPSTTCMNSVSTFTTETNMLNYSWTVSEGGEIIGPANENAVNIQWHSTGNQWVSVNYQSPYGCTITPTTINVYIYEVPNPKLSGPIGPMCLTDDVMTYTTDASQLTYYWNCSTGGTIVSGGGANQNYISIKWTQPGQQFVKVNYSTKHYCMAPEPTVLTITINPTPVPTIGGPDLVLIDDTTNLYQTETGMLNYYWEVDSDGEILSGGGSDESFARISWHAIGLHQVSVTYTDLNGCSGTTSYDVYVTNTIKSSGSDPSGGSLPGSGKVSFNVYPVPNNGRFTVSIDSPVMDRFSIHIFNGLGAEIYVQQNIQVEGNYKQFVDISHVAEGVYTVIISNGNTQTSKRIHIRK